MPLREDPEFILLLWFWKLLVSLWVFAVHSGLSLSYDRPFSFSKEHLVDSTRVNPASLRQSDFAVFPTYKSIEFKMAGWRHLI